MWWCNHTHLTWPHGLWWPLAAVIGASHIEGGPDDFAIFLLARPAARGGGSLIIACLAFEMQDLSHVMVLGQLYEGMWNSLGRTTEICGSTWQHPVKADRFLVLILFLKILCSEKIQTSLSNSC